MVKRIAIFGSTGSIGRQTLEVIAAHPDKFTAEILTAYTNEKLLIEQALAFNPSVVVIADEKKYKTVKDALSDTMIKVFAGESALCEVALMDCYDLMLAAIVGYAGFKPTLNAIDTGKAVALANKETLVVAGDIVMQRAYEKRVPVIPVDSEHSAIFQCLVGEGRNKIEKIILTASGGPFLGKKPNFLVNVKRDHALQHPNWNMGAKITIDSATLMNKGLEVIEAHWLFGASAAQIEVVVHPQSIVHSLVEYADGSVLAQLGNPDMRTALAHALAWPDRVESGVAPLDLLAIGQLNFEAPDRQTFRCLDLAYQALAAGGTAPTTLNAANEVAVAAFLEGTLPFLAIAELIEATLDFLPATPAGDLEALVYADLTARREAQRIMQRSFC